MQRSRRASGAAPRDDARVPRVSRITLRPNRRNTSPLVARLPRPREVIDACGRALRRAAPALVGLAIASVVGTGLWFGWRFLTTSPRFAVTAVEVRGAHEIGPDEVRALLPFHPGANIFRLDTGAAEAALRRHPWIAGATVRRELPHTVVVEIRERTAAAVVAADGLYLVDADGRPFKRAAIDHGEGAGLPVVSGVTRALYAAEPDLAAARVKRGLAVLAAWRASAADAVRPAAGEVRVDGRGATLYTWDDAVAVALGDADGAALDARLHRFDAAWAALTPEERRRTRAVHVDNDTRSDLVTVSFATN